MQYHPRLSAACRKRASVDLSKHINIISSIAHYRRFTGGTATGMDTYKILTWHGKQAKGIVISKDLLLGKRDFGQVFHRLNVARLYTQTVEHLAIIRNLLVNILYSITKPLILQFPERLAGHRFDFSIEEHWCLPLLASGYRG